ncbi:hypothetical protein BLNAU_17692 [Blattamonas nauphoetae]|uniref:Uncharacterized protein n=1 Tax=Blattamonas nauphoetae TaxID=2049346 RepID=A0ABQ9X6H6_9EUKA|nr:hypothetical protein BLNAU_17692 [Blattamonas nauphoetae]
MKMFDCLFERCSLSYRLALLKASLIPLLIITLNPLSLSFAKSEDIHTCLMSGIASSLWLSTPDGFEDLGIKDGNAKQRVHETMIDAQLGWNKSRGEMRQTCNCVHRQLRMEGIEDVMEAKLRNDTNGSYGGSIPLSSIEWNNVQGMNLP